MLEIGPNLKELLEVVSIMVGMCVLVWAWIKIL